MGVSHMDAPETQKRISEDLRRLGLRSGGVVLVHSSLKSMGRVPGGPETVVRGLLGALGPRGTLLFPALSFRTVNSENPVFDVRRTPSCIGAIPEHFRTRAGTVRSIQPTHSVCGVGPRANELLGEHHHDETSCGPHSPFRKLRDVGGQILMLGCGLKPNTSMHGVEELVEPPYLFEPPITYRIVFADRRQMHHTCRSHGFDGYAQRYDRLGDVIQGDDLRVGQVMEATAHLIETKAMWDRAGEAMAREPFYFVDRR